MRAKIAIGAIVGIWSITLLSDLWSTAGAATIYWDGTGASWNSVSSWSTVNNATTPDPAAVPGAADLADFDIIFVSNQTVDLNAAQSALGLEFNNRSGSTTIQSGTGKGTNTLTLGSSGITVNTGAGADTISAAISLGSAQMWTNNSSSTLTINGNMADATNLLTIAGSGNTSLGGVLGSGSGGLTMSGSGTLTLSGANNYTGATMVNTGTLVLGNASALGTTAGGTTVTSGATLDLDGQTVGAEPLTISGTGLGGNGALINSSAFFPATFGGTITNQTFTVGGSGNINLTGSINGTATLTKIGTGTLTLSGTTDNNGLSLAVDAGTVVLAKTSSHAPNDVHAVGWDLPLLGMVISGGTVQLGGTGGDQIYDSANVTVTSGAFDTNGQSETFATLNLQGTGIGGGGALVNGAFSGYSILTVTSGTTLTGDTTIGVASVDSTLELDNAISGNFGLTMIGSGTLVLKGTNTFSGGLTVASGALLIPTINNAGTNGALGNNTSVTLGSGGQTATLLYDGSSSASTNMPFVLAAGGTGAFYIDRVGTNLTLNGSINGTGTLNAEIGTLTLGGSNTFTGGVTISDGDLRLANSGALNSSSPNSVTFTDNFVPTSIGMLSLQGNSVTVSDLSTSGSGSIVQDVVQNASATAATLTVSITANISNTFAGILQDGTGGGALSLVKSGQGNLILTGVNTFSGGLTVANGALQIHTINDASTNGVLGNNTSVTLGSSGQTGTLLYDGNSSASTNMPFVLATGGTGAFFDDTVGVNLTLNGRISGTGTLNAVIGTVTLGGSNTFTGGVTISDGDLRLANPGALNSSSPNSVTFDDTFVPTSTGMLSLQGNSVTVSGLSTNVSGSIVQDVVQNASATAATLTVSTTGSNTFAGILQDGTGGGAFSLVKSGAGTLTLGGANTYSGVTTVNAGKLAINGSIVSNVTVNAGGTLQGTGSIGGLVTVKSGAALSPGNSGPGVITLGSLTLNAGAQTGIELGGSTRGSQYDAILSSGNVNLGGTLIVSLINGFAPVAGSSFDILDWGMRSSKFASVSLPSLPSGLVWSTLGLYSSGELIVANSTLLPGDFNRDGIVDARDIAPMMQALTNLSVYQSSHGNISTPQVTLLGDINGDGQFTNADLQSFLSALKSGDGSTDSVPEPASIALAGLGALAIAFRRRSGWRHLW